MYERFGDTKSDPEIRVALGVRLKLSLASAAENVAQLVADELLDVGTGGLEILGSSWPRIWPRLWAAL